MTAAMDDGFADCEQRDEWFLEQDVNAWTSLAYVAAGVLLGLLVLRRRLPTVALALGAVTALEGVGSVVYHGSTGDLAQILHDAPLVGMLGFVAGWQAGRLVGAPDRGALAGMVVGLGVGAVVAVPGWTNAVAAVLVVVVVLSEVGARRRGLTPVWNVPLLALGGAAALMWVTGTPDSPVCAEGSWLQPHGVWHVLSALLVVAWADRAYGAEVPDHAPHLFRRLTDRGLGLAAGGLVYAFHRSVDVVGRDSMPADGPVLVVANHGNGFVDPVVVTGVLGVLPRFLAKATLWKVWIARPFLWLAGVLPVYRASDGSGTDGNRSVFERCHHEPARGATVAIFPEGTTGDRAGLDKVKTGAARIALGAVAAGAPDLQLAPIGLAFENRVETRSRAVVMFGDPIAVAPFARHGVGPDGEPDRGDVDALTDAITDALEAVSPEFASVEEREVLRAAARTERDAALAPREARFGEIEAVARKMAAAPVHERAEVMDAYRRYATRVHLLGLHDRQIEPTWPSTGRLVLAVVATVVLGPFLLTAALVHLPAVALVVVATALVTSTATKGTVRVLVGAVALLATWILAGMILADGWASVATALALAVGGALALAVWTPFQKVAWNVWGAIRIRDRVGLLPPVRRAQDRVVHTVRDVVGELVDVVPPRELASPGAQAPTTLAQTSAPT